jgi:hypothetical protein
LIWCFVVLFFIVVIFLFMVTSPPDSGIRLPARVDHEVQQRLLDVPRRPAAPPAAAPSARSEPKLHRWSCAWGVRKSTALPQVVDVVGACSALQLPA